MAEDYEEELNQLVEVAGTGMYGSAALKKRIATLLHDCKGKVKTAHQIRKEWEKIKGSLTEEIVKMRTAE